MMKKILSAVLCVVMLICTCSPAFAVSIEPKDIDDIQDEINTVSELITLLRKAEKAGDEADVELYESLLAKLGVLQFDSNELTDYMAKQGLSFNNPQASEYGVYSLPDTDSTTVDWRVYNYNGYYYPEKASYYDVAVFYASPRNKDSGLVTTGKTEPNDEFQLIMENFGEYVASYTAQKIVEIAANNIVSIAYDISDFINTMLDGVDPYTIDEMSLGHWNTHWLCDTTFCYIFIREANTSNSYYYAFCGSQLLVDYYYTQTISVEMEDGRSEEHIYSIEVLGEVISNSNYNNIKMAADAYEEYGQNGFAYGLTIPKITLFKGTDKAIEVPFECATYKSPYEYTSLQEGT